MQNQEIIKLIDNLKGRKNYETKKATKLGFTSLYDYFEDKIFKQKKDIIDKKRELAKAQNELNTKKNDKKNSCACC